MANQLIRLKTNTTKINLIQILTINSNNYKFLKNITINWKTNDYS